MDRLKARLKDLPTKVQEKLEDKLGIERPPLKREDTLTSVLSESRFAVLPHGERLEGWTHEEKLELDDMVRHELHSRRAKIKRGLKGFGQYVRRRKTNPSRVFASTRLTDSALGLFITVYATLITLFGAAWVFFLIGWISLGSKRDYIINVVDNVLVALFAVIGDGLAPFRAVDTYHMAYIAHYYRKTWKIRKKLGLPELEDHNDLPDVPKDVLDNGDLESIAAIRRTSTFGSIRSAQRAEYSVLTEKEQEKLEFHERKFSKSHTFFKPHETATHYAFPLRLLVAIVFLLDMHSCLQISLGACTWGIPYKSRPFALTTVILCCSITCNILGGVLISIGDHRTRKKEVIETMMRQELTADGIEKIEKRKMKQAEEQGLIDRSFRKQAEDEQDEAEWKEIKKEWKTVPLLPKKLLGKGEDHREPALPQKQRQGTGKSRKSLDSSRTSLDNSRMSMDRKGKAPVSASPDNITPVSTSGPSWSRLGQRSSAPSVPPVPEAPEPSHGPPLPLRPNPEAEKESKRDRVMRFIRRADLDLS
jgi:hypothetical protein